MLDCPFATTTQQTQAPANRNARSKQWQPCLAACQLKRLRLNGNRAWVGLCKVSVYLGITILFCVNLSSNDWLIVACVTVNDDYADNAAAADNDCVYCRLHDYNCRIISCWRIGFDCSHSSFSDHQVRFFMYKFIKAQPNWLLTLTFQPVLEAFIRRWFSVLLVIDMTGECRVKKAVV